MNKFKLFEYGTIIYFDKKGNKHIGYYDDDEGSKAVVYRGDLMSLGGWFLIDYKYCFNNVTMKDLIDCKEFLKTEICKLYKSKNKNKLVELLSELNYVNELFYERHILTMGLKKGTNIFISYSNDDKSFALDLYSDLVSEGYSPWLDEYDIKGGDSIPKKIQEGITNSDYVVVILSENSVNSKWVNEEWQTKYWDEINENKVKVVPILIENCKIPALLKKKKYIDFREDYHKGLYYLYKSLV